MKPSIVAAIGSVFGRLTASLERALRKRYALLRLSNSEPETEILSQLCNPTKMSLDIGANAGIYSLLLQDQSLSVVAFEPNPVLARELTRRFRYSNVTVSDFALGDQNGVAELMVPSAGEIKLVGWGRLVQFPDKLVWRGFPITSVERIPVNVRRLDDLRLRGIGFIKVDVEGAESQVLAGAEQTLRTDRPNMIVEIEGRHQPRGGSIYRVFDQIREIGYQGFFLWRGGLRPISDFDVAALAIS